MTEHTLTKPEVTILIPHYKTPELVRVCLTLLEKYTPPNLAHYIVIDNDSQDSSLEYLRNLSWIELIERKSEPDDTPPLSHSRALDMALMHVTTPYVLSIHTDTLVKDPGWLSYLLHQINAHENIGGVGSWKLETHPFHKRMLKKIERKIQLSYYGLINKKNHAIEGVGKNYFYLRSHCALYRMDLIKKYQLTFSDENETAGKVMHKKLTDHGHEMLFLESHELRKYLDHINHATMVLNPELGIEKKAIRRGHQRIKRFLNL